MRDKAMLLFMETMLNGGDSSAAVEASEKRGQAEAVRRNLLPIMSSDTQVPKEILNEGLDKNVLPTSNEGWTKRFEIRDKNIIKWTKAQYEKMGIKIIEIADDIFYKVELPEGWEIKATSHAMWNEVVDNKGRKRMNFFYKASFYDRRAHSNFLTRFRLSVEHVAPEDSDYDVWKRSNFIGKVFDGETVIYSTEEVPAPEDESIFAEEDIKEKLNKKLETFIISNYPDYKDINAYWD